MTITYFLNHITFSVWINTAAPDERPGLRLEIISLLLIGEYLNF